MHFVGIHARFKGGKDTLAGWLKASLEKWTTVYIRHFAAELRNAIEKASGGKIKAAETWSEQEKAAKIPLGIKWDLLSIFPHIKEPVQKEWETRKLPEMAATGQTIGKLLQEIGMLGRQVEGSDIWVRRFEEKLPKIEPNSKCVVLIPDFRFQDPEADWLLRHAATLIKIDTGARKIVDNTGRDLSHASETGLANFKQWSLVIDNSGTLKEFEEKAQVALYYVNAQVSGIYVTRYELVQLLKTRLDALEKNQEPLYKVPASVHDLCEVAREECKRGLLSDYVIEREILNQRVKTLVRFLILPQEY